MPPASLADASIPAPARPLRARDHQPADVAWLPAALALGLLLFGTLGVPLDLLVAPGWRAEGSGPWRGRYFARPDLLGPATVRHEPDLRFDWGSAPPLDGLPADRYSARWDTCLTLDSDRELRLQLTADNPVKLVLDNRVVLDLPAHTTQTADTTLTLAAGVHHLRVELRKAGPRAQLTLTAGRDGEPLRALPPAQLSPPQSGVDNLSACD